MKLIEFLTKEDGSVSVDWAVMAAVVAGLCLATAGVLSGGLDSFSRYNARDLAMQNASGKTLFDSENYVPQNDALYNAYVDGLSGLSLDELDALAGFANRLHAAGVADDLAEGEEACNAGNGQGYGVGYCDRFGGNSVANTADFLMAVDHEYAVRGKGRPSHTHIDGPVVGAAFESMGLSQTEVRALLQS